MADRRNVPAIQIHLLGGFRFVVDGRSMNERTWGRRKPLQLLKCLLTRPNRRITEGEAAELFWPDSDPEAVRSTIGSTLSTIRSKLGWSKEDGNADLLSRDHGVLSILPEAGVWVDADELEDLLRRAKDADDPCALLEEADRLYSGEYLPDDQYEDWARDRREYLKRLRAEHLFELARCREQRGDITGAQAALESVLREDRCDERAARELMELLARDGRRPEAIRVYKALVKSLKDELGFEPSRESVDCYQRIMSNTSAPPHALAPAPPSPPPPIQPDAGPVPTDRGPAEEWLDPLRFMPAYPFPAPELLVGRQGELATLEKILEAGLVKGQVALVSAPAGTGKSALLGALVQRARRAGFLCLVGGGYEGNSVLPLGPFHDALADFLLWQPAEQVKAESAGGLDDLALLIPELLQHLNLPDRPASDPATAQLHLRATLHMYLRRLAERQPVLICLEDLHAADEATLAMIVFLAQQLVRHRVVIVGTFRTEELRPGRPLSERVNDLRRATRLDLKPLNRQHTDRMVASLLDGKPSDRLVESLFATTDGNPLFVEQLVLALREEGRIDQRNGTWRQVGDLSGVPTIIRDVIGQRLDRLSDQARQTLALASVLGRAFEYGALVAATATDDERTLMEALDEAFEAQILYDSPTGYAFSHAIIREVVYARLTAPRRMVLHEQAGRGLERWAGDRANEHAADLARHFSLAGRKPELRQKALHYGLEAGHRAAALSAHRDALDHFQRACELTDGKGLNDCSLEAQLDALEGLGHAQRELGQWPAAVASFGTVLSQSEEPLQRARVHGALSYGHHHMGDLTRALAEADAGLAELAGLDHDPRVAFTTLRIQFAKAIIWFLQGRYLNLARLGGEMVILASQTDEPLSRTWAHSAVAWAHLGMGQVNDALAQYDLAMAAAEQSNSRVEIAILHDSIGIQSYRGGRFSAAIEHLNRAIEIHSDSASELRTVNAVQTLGRLWLARGDVEQASHHARSALDLAIEGRHRWMAECYDLFGQIHTVRCEWTEALESFDQALAIRERVGHAAGIVESLLGRGLVHELHGDWNRARADYRQALQTAETMDPSPQLVLARCHLGLLELHLGNEDVAAREIDAGRALAETMTERLEYASALLASAELALELAATGDAVGHAEQALQAARTVECSLRARATLIMALLASGQVAAAGDQRDQLLRAAEQFGSPILLGLARLSIGRLATASERLDDAMSLLKSATADFAGAETPYWHGIALIEECRARRQADETHCARSTASAALDMLERVGARRAAEQARSLLGGPPGL